MDSITDIVDGIVDELVQCKVIENDDRLRAFLAIEDSLKTTMEVFGIKIVFKKN